uniref:Uncharacterized protein n=1 Tax=Cacopsylla melanoneura TaxID=428564 RepID=A0A8D9BVJ1_9HEMI
MCSWERAHTRIMLLAESCHFTLFLKSQGVMPKIYIQNKNRYLFIILENRYKKNHSYRWINSYENFNSKKAVPKDISKIMHFFPPISNTPIKNFGLLTLNEIR